MPTLNLGRIYKVGTALGRDGINPATYVLRGMIVYYGRHYWAYFYSQKFDTWFQFDDEHITRTGNFADVVDKSVRGKAIPRTLFYEKQDLVVNMLLDGEDITGQTDLSKIYCSDSQMQHNNFWKNRKEQSGGSTRCTIF